MLNLSYDYKLKPTEEQVLEIERTLIICRKVWNHALRERKDWINSRKCPINACSIVSEYIISSDSTYPNYFVQATKLTKAKELCPELKTVNAQMLQQVLRKLETAFVDMKRKGMGFPRFKNKYRMRSFVFPQMLKNCIQGNSIKLPQLGIVEFIKSREIPDGFVVKQARILWKASGYFVILSLECDIFVEDIDFRVWAKGMFCKHTLDAGFGQFISILSWVCWKQGVYFEKVNKDYTSQICPNCDGHTGKKTLDTRVHNCSECGYTTHRDVAAAQVIRNRGLSAEGRFVDIKEIACGGGLAGTGNSLVKSQRDKKKNAPLCGLSPLECNL